MLKKTLTTLAALTLLTLSLPAAGSEAGPFIDPNGRSGDAGPFIDPNG